MSWYCGVFLGTRIVRTTIYYDPMVEPGDWGRQHAEEAAERFMPTTEASLPRAKTDAGASSSHEARSKIIDQNLVEQNGA